MKNISFMTLAAFFMLMVVSNFSSINFYSLMSEDHQLNDFISIAIALDEETGDDGVCFRHQDYRCPITLMEAVSCNGTGDYKQGEECTEFDCGGREKKLKCPPAPVEV